MNFPRNILKNLSSRILNLSALLALLLTTHGAKASLDLEDSYKEMELQEIKLKDLFYTEHLGTKYNPIKLEASLFEEVELDLKGVLAQAVENNINLNIAKQDSVIAKWQFWNEFSNALPDITLQALTQDFNGTFFINSRIQADVDESQVQGKFRIDHRLFDGGTTSFLIWAEKYYKNAVKEDEQKAYNQTLLDAVNFYNALLKDQVALSSRLKSLEEAKSNLDLAEKFQNAGTGTKLDVYQAEARLARAQQELIEQEASFRVSEINLAEHLNLPLLTPIKIASAQITPLNIIEPDIEFSEFLELAEENNPEIKAAIARKKGARREALARVGDFLPKVDVFADWTNTGEDINDTFNIRTLGIQASLELGEGIGFTAVSSGLKSRAEAKKAVLLLKQEELRIEKELRKAFLDYEKSKSLVEATQKELKASKESLRLSKLRYQNGLEILVNVLEKEQEFSNAQSSFINSVADYNFAQANLAYYMGNISVESILN